MQAKGTIVASVLQADEWADELREKVLAHYKSIGYGNVSGGGKLTVGNKEDSKEWSKDDIRNISNYKRYEKLKDFSGFVSRNVCSLICHFASGDEIEPEEIRPELELIERAGTWQHDLFLLSTLTWGVPVSDGVGRKMKYLVWDRHNDKLIGIIGLGDDVLNISARDRYIGWTGKTSDRMRNLMNAYVLGALPPYNRLLCGKLVACVIKSKDVYNDFAMRYGSSRTNLLVVTTGSSMGRSSIYNRLKLDGRKYFVSVGYSKGFGHGSFPKNLFSEISEYLRFINHDVCNIRRKKFHYETQMLMAGLTSIGLDGKKFVYHGIKRELFVCEMVDNALDILCVDEGVPDTSSLLTASEVARLALKRWVIPRSCRMTDWKSWDKRCILEAVGADKYTLQTSIF